MLDLSAGGNHVEDMGFCQVLDCCPRVELLNVSHCNLLTDAALNHLSTSHPKLKVLSMEGCLSFSLEALLGLVSELKQLRSLDTSYLSKAMSDSVAHELFNHNQRGSPNNQVTYLNLRECRQLSDFSWLRYAGNLVWLNLHGCPNVNDDVVETIARHCPNLTRLNVGKDLPESIATLRKVGLDLDVFREALHSLTGEEPHVADSVREPRLSTDTPPLSGTARSIVVRALAHAASGEYHITDRSIVPLLKSCPKLELLQLNYSSITDASLLAIIHHNTSLKSLWLVGCPFITTNGIITLNELTSLELVNMHGCPLVNIDKVCESHVWRFLNTSDKANYKHVALSGSWDFSHL
jgi:hypothetical protein